jgi:Na+/proline symporter/nitrogen-specific signal transduction histidine kinase
MNPSLLIGLSFSYLLLLFGIAFWSEKRSREGRSLVANPYIYALSLAVYCTAWTYYGSVERAASGGIDFLAVYTGASLMVPLFWPVLRKIIRICKVQRISTLADFISSRYGKNISLGGIVTVLSVLGIIPYISLQLKAISASLEVVTAGALHSGGPWLADSALYLALILAFFTILFGTRQIEATERHEGMVTAVAFESVIKLLAFLTIGIFVTFGLYNGFGDLFQQAANLPGFADQLTLHGDFAYGEWFTVNLLSMLAVFLLPRQFQVAVVENVNEKHLTKAMWLFPLYLLLINLFVLPIATGGQLLLGDSVRADAYVLGLPMQAGKPGLTLLTYIGGFSAATSMIIVEVIALSTMISNNLVMPLLVANTAFQQRIRPRLGSILILSRRLAILLLLLLAYAYFRSVAVSYSLVSIGLVSFAAVAQLAPAVLGGIFWKNGNRRGAIAGLLVGFALWFYTLVVPSIVGAGILPESLLHYGPWGIDWLRPAALFGISGLDNLSQGLFWSLGANLMFYITISLRTRQDSKERNQAEVFVDIFRYSTVYESSIVWKGTAYMPDLRSLLENFLGRNRTLQALNAFKQKYQVDWEQPGKADPRLVTYAEKLLGGAIGTASARIMVSTVVKEEDISRDEVVDILRESQQLLSVNRELRRKSMELRKATEQLSAVNARLQEQDELKDEFLYTVTHELRTPLTSIRALSEILHDNPDLPPEQQQQFLSTMVRETERLSRLISQVLDLEKYASGKQKLQLAPCQLQELIHDAVDGLQQLIREKQLLLKIDLQPGMPEAVVDRDRIYQVIVNLLSNAIKFCEADKGRIVLSAYYLDGDFKVNVADNGKGIEEDQQQYIFDKFYQARNQTTRKPKGTGLGLAISKSIIDLHQGSLWVDSAPGKGARFSFTLPRIPSP